MPELLPSAKSPYRARALLLGDRINTAGIDPAAVVCPAPLTYRFGGDGFVTLFRYGVAVLTGLTPEHLIVIADALAKSVVLARDEREVAAVFDLVEPFARQLAEKGGSTGGRRAILKHIGNALLVQHRVSGRVAVTEKPDLVWDRPDLERLTTRLQDEYELKERADALSRKLSVIAETAEVLTDIIDTRRSLRLEIIIVALIALELVVAGYQILR